MISAADYDFLSRFLKAKSGLALSKDKQYLIESRLDPVVQKFALPDLTRLVAQLRDAPAAPLVEAVVNAMTTNESLFFRDKTPFELLTTTILPDLCRRRPAAQPLRIWCAAASTGQEPYSIAMLLQENVRLLGGRKVEIIATDLSTEVIARAQQGIYNQFEVQRGLPVQYLLRYFRKTGELWQVSDDIRAMVRFSNLNLLQPFSHLGMFDVVFCRNVLIYFDIPTKADILARVGKVLTKDGYLLLGGAETVLGISSEFVAGPQRGYYVQATAGAPAPVAFRAAE